MGEKKQAQGLLTLPGIATHFKPKGSRRIACGLAGLHFTSPLAKDVDCQRCRKTKLFRDYAI
jgi:hypothetical protein